MNELQGDEWKLAKCGWVGASHISDIMAKGRNGEPSRSRATFMGQIIAERLTGKPTKGFQSSAMEYGIEKEAEARLLYEISYGVEVTKCSFIRHPRLTYAGASPDGLIGHDGLVEFKCPLVATHIDTLLSGTIDRTYHLQMQWQLASTGRAWVDFVSFDDRLPPAMQLWCRRVFRDDDLIARITVEVEDFLRETAERIVVLTTRYPEAA